LQTERLSLQTALITWNAARRRRDVAAVTLDDVADRYRNGTARTTIEHLLSARDDLFLAEHAELDAHAPWLEACHRLRMFERQRGLGSGTERQPDLISRGSPARDHLR
jgi:hypothetical protein